MYSFESQYYRHKFDICPHCNLYQDQFSSCEHLSQNNTYRFCCNHCQQLFLVTETSRPLLPEIRNLANTYSVQRIMESLKRKAEWI